MDTTMLLVARLPCRQAKPSAHIVLALDRIVAREAVYKEGAGQSRRQGGGGGRGRRVEGGAGGQAPAGRIPRALVPAQPCEDGARSPRRLARSGRGLRRPLGVRQFLGRPLQRPPQQQTDSLIAARN